MNNFDIYIIFKSRTKRNNYPVGKVTPIRNALLHWERIAHWPVECLRREQIGHIGLSRHLSHLLYLLLYIIFVLGLEFDGRIGDDSSVVLFELIASIFCLEWCHYILHTFIFAEEALILTSALNWCSSGYEDGHLFEDFAGSEYGQGYLLWSFSFRAYLL